ncbi:MAG: exodeoxyribonuclease VII large subunit [Oscillospiraceae bacterium]|nr:exodeoxyribonuclease VII large subunit [Oscillospiraceae bacterium]
MVRESITVTALNQYVKSLLESDEVLSQIWVEGEISTFKLHSASGHMYFRLIDKHCGVKCVMFYSYASKLKFVPKDGMKVLVKCKVSLYEASGDFQLYVYDMVEKGAGERQNKFEQLKEKLLKLGYFDESRKKKIPIFPKTVGIISSQSGAALQDIINVLSQRDPFVNVTLYSVNVQGAFAVDSICRMIDIINNDENPPEVLIISRGGGSKDDLWIFNEEKLLLAASSLKVPFISAVGHEIDITLLDLLADLRVPTPTAAAVAAVPDISELLSYRETTVKQLHSIIIDNYSKESDHLQTLKQSLDSSFIKYISDIRKKVLFLEKTCNDLSPMHVLQRGYAIVQKDASPISSIDDVKPGDEILVRFYDGEANCHISEVSKYEI